MTLEERITKLEKQITLWAALTVLVGIGAGVAACLAFRPAATPSVIRATRIEVVDGHGNPKVGLMATRQGGGRIFLFDAEGKIMLWAGEGKEGGGSLGLYNGGNLSTWNTSGKQVATIQSSKANCGFVAVCDFNGEFKHGILGQ